MWKLFLTKSREIEEFAHALAADLLRRFPPASESRTDAGAKKQIDVILQGLGARAARYRDERRLGVYGKARLANAFKWKLKDAGYSSKFVDGATRALTGFIAVDRRTTR